MKHPLLCVAPSNVAKVEKQNVSQFKNNPANPFKIRLIRGSKSNQSAVRCNLFLTLVVSNQKDVL
jgi:hypothetical protein